MSYYYLIGSIIFVLGCICYLWEEICNNKNKNKCNLFGGLLFFIGSLFFVFDSTLLVMD